MEKTAEQWIKELELTPHIEGGYYRQILKSKDTIQQKQSTRSLYTSIYFLLEENNPSHLHRLTSDEVWYFHAGEPLTIHLLFPNGDYQTIRLGYDSTQKEQLQAVVPKGVIFGSSVQKGYALVSCMVAPGFEYSDFELMNRDELLEQYPQYKDMIVALTRETSIDD